MGYSLMQLRRGILLNTPHLATASGELATFRTDMAAKLKKLFTSFEPVQSLNGYDKPWPGGASINLYDDSAVTDGYYISATGVITESTISCYSGLIPVVAGQAYTYSGRQTYSGSNNKRFHAYADGVWQEQILAQSVPQGAFAVTFTIPAGCNGLRISAHKDDTSRMVELGSTASTYVPYANICPISGYTGINFTQARANLAYRESGETANIYNARHLIPVKTGEKIYVYAEFTYTSSSAMWAAVYASRTATNKNNYLVQYSSLYSGSVKTYTITRDGYFGVAYNAGVATYTVSKMMISKTPITSAADYVPYDPTVIPVSWQSEAGTVYGGTLDAATGLLTIDRVCVTLNNETWSLQSASSVNPRRFSKSYSAGGWPSPASTRAAISSHFDGSGYNSSSKFGKMSITGSYFIFADSDSQFATAADFRTWVHGQYENGTPVQVSYKIAEPQIIQLSPAEVRALIGANNIWADTGAVGTEYWTHLMEVTS